MKLNRRLLFLILQLLHGVTGTLVKLRDGGFEDVVVAINPALHEDQNIVDNIKEMIQEASTYLFKATKQRFYFRTVKVIIPEKWTSKPEYKRVTIESYEQADVIVADPFLKYGDDPYTLQYGGCGEKGRYIHFTSNFLTNDKLVNVYGPRGRVFVHEWAHLRWGVFDEYNYDAPFYITGKNKIEATRCSAEITGQYILQNKTGKIRSCKIDQQTGLYENGCQFVPERKQNATASLMYMQSLPSVIEFCDKSNHNIEATNMQNKLCNYRSTWEVIMDSADFANSTPIAAPPPAPTIFLLQQQQRVLCLVLDVSGSMNSYDRINRLRRAADLFLVQIIEPDSWVGIVTFQSTAEIVTDLKQLVNFHVRKTLTTKLPTTADGGTSICSGILAGFQVFLSKFNSTEGCEIVLLTDGEDSSIGSCFAEVEKSGSKIHVVALGPDAAKELEKLSDMTGGLHFAATDSLDSTSLIDTFSKISSESGNISQQPIQLESQSQSIGSDKSLSGVVPIDKSVGNDTFFVVMWNVSTSPPIINLMDPSGKKYLPSDFEIDNTNVRLARLKINGTAVVGDWTYEIKNTHTAAQVISMTVTTRARSLTKPPVTVKTYMNRDNIIYPNPMVIYAEVSQGFLPVIGANVTATVEQESTPPENIPLKDDGLGADTLKHDGIYSGYFFSFKVNGRYNLKVRVQGEEKTVRRVRRQSQAIFVPGYVEPDGEINLNPPRLEPNEFDRQANPGNFSRVTSGESVKVSNVPSGNFLDVIPPGQITDLQVVPVDDGAAFLLSWTAPGNDYDVGTAERYEIKMSRYPSELRNDSFSSAISVNTSGLIPVPARTKQYFKFKPENFTNENGSSIYFAMRAIDNSSNIGEISNIAVLGRPTLPTTLNSTTSSFTATSSFTTVSQKENNTGISNTAIIAIAACACAMLISAMVEFLMTSLVSHTY